MNNDWLRLELTYEMASGAIYEMRYERDGTSRRRPIRIKVLRRPRCPYRRGLHAHLLDDEYICILHGREPRRLARAEAIAMHWMRGFEEYRTSGVFPNGKARIQVD